MAQANQLTQEYKEFVELFKRQRRFERCYAHRKIRVLDEVPSSFISLEALRQNKASTGRLKDQLDLQNLNERNL